MNEKIAAAIDTLAAQITDVTTPTAAMQLSQAALNLAHVQLALINATRAAQPAAIA